MLWIFVALFFFNVSPVVHAAQVERELEGVKRKIEKEKQGITSVQREEDSLHRGLQACGLLPPARGP